MNSLAGTAILESLSEADLRHLEGRCKWRHYRNGQTVFEAGSPSKEVFFISEGLVNVINTSVSGKEVVFASFGPGDIFGELAALDGHPRSASIVAAEPTRLAVLASQHFLGLLERHPKVTIKVLQSLTQMVRMGDIKIVELSTLAASQRVYSELLRMAVPDAVVPGQWVIRSLPPLRQIASRVGTTRETVARAMAQVYGVDLVRRKGRNLYLMDRAKLEALAKYS